jgi:aarF domain-containing kinase
VPSTQLGRALGFASMGASLLLGSFTDSISRTLGGGSSSDGSNSSGSSGSSGNGSSGSRPNVYGSFITESNAERLAAALCRMRGAALKIGQMLSIQDETVLPPQVRREALAARVARAAAVRCVTPAQVWQPHGEVLRLSCSRLCCAHTRPRPGAHPNTHAPRAADPVGAGACARGR